MEKTITIDGKPTVFKCTGGFLLRYRELTGRDPITDIGQLDSLPKNKQKVNVQDLSTEDFMLLYNLIWVMAKTANPDIPDLIDWIDSFNDFPVVDIFVELKDLVIKAFKSNLTMRDVKKKAPAVQRKTR